MSNFTFACGASGPSTGPDVVYQFYPPVSGTLRVTLTPEVGYDAVLSVGTACSGSGFACLTTDTMGMPATTSFPVSMDTVYYVLVGSSVGVGNYTIRFEYL
jgi:hypothetical protein